VAATVIAQPQRAQPVLVQHLLGVSSARAGDRLTLAYLIMNSASAPVAAVLRATLRQRAANAQIDDPGDEQAVTLAPGTQMYQRVFQVPATLVPGPYDVDWSVVSTDSATVYAQVTDPNVLTLSAAAPTPQPTLAPTAVPPTPVPPTAVPTVPPAAPTPTLALVQAAPSPADAVRTFYTLLNQGDYARAWDFLGPRFKSGNSYAGWVKGYATTQSVTVASASTVDQSGPTATVNLTIVSVDRQAAGQLLTQTFQGTWNLVLIDGAWKLDVPSIRRV
jgi:hypothetical protein